MSPRGTDTAARHALDLGRALIDPAAAFGSPDDVVRDAQLPVRHKIEILCRWAYDSAELLVAEEEGMDGGESMDMGAILKALNQITEIDVQHCAPTKHAAFCVAAPVQRASIGRQKHGAAAAMRMGAATIRGESE